MEENPENIKQSEVPVSKNELESEFEEFFKNCKKENLNYLEIRRILKPLKYKIWKIYLRKYLTLIFAFLTICWLFYQIDFLNWHICALGRLSMIKILPIWNWKSLYNAKCLITNNDYTSKSSSTRMKQYSLRENDCLVCKNIDAINVINNTSYPYLRDQHLLRGTPVIVAETIEPSENWKIDNFAQYLSKQGNLINRRPCQVQTNLAMSKYINLEYLLNLLLTMDNDYEKSWFLHFRNCDFEALRTTRLFMEIPYFYPRHLESPYSTWILMSQNYESKKAMQLELDGLVIVTQMKGDLNVNLKSKDICYNHCGEHHFMLKEGESLIYLTDLWRFSYTPLKTQVDSLTFITETYFVA